MSNYSVSNIENLISLLNEKHNNLLSVVKGNDLSKHDLEIRGFSQPHVSINPRELRIAIDEVSAVLKETKRLAK